MYPTVIYERDTYIDPRTSWAYEFSELRVGRKGNKYAPAGSTISGPETLLLVKIGDARPADSKTKELVKRTFGWDDMGVDLNCKRRKQDLIDMRDRMLERAMADDDEDDDDPPEPPIVITTVEEPEADDEPEEIEDGA